MLTAQAAPAWYGGLGRADAPAIAAHWRRLPEDCIRRRFLRRMRPEDLARHAEAIVGPDAHAIGWFCDGALRGVGELFRIPGGGEAAFTVEPGWRRRGVGQGLMRRLLRRAAHLGLRQVIVMTTRDNLPMVRLAESAGARLEFDGAEVTGVIPLAPATAASRLLEAAEETASGLASVVDGAARIAAAWRPAAR